MTMNNFQKSLDKYLTSEPDDNFYEYYWSKVTNLIDDNFYEENEAWFEDFTQDAEINELMLYCYNNNLDPKEAADYITNKKTKI